MVDPATSVETQLALLNQKVDLLLVAANERGADHEQRIRKLEQFKWVMVGLAAAAGSASGAAASAVASKAIGG